MSDSAKGCLGALAFLLAMTGWMYWEVRDQHKFAPAVTGAMTKVPGTRLVSSFKSGELINPISLFWMPTTRLVYATPDVTLPGGSRFFLSSFDIEAEDEPSIMLVDVDCKNKRYTYYHQSTANRRNEGELARNVLGKPVKAPNGSFFRRHDSDISPNKEQLAKLCKEDWSDEIDELTSR